MTADSNCLTVRCFRGRATSSKLDCRRLSVQFVKMDDFDERMSDGPEQMPEQPDSPVDLTEAPVSSTAMAPSWCERRCTADGDRRLQLFDISSFSMLWRRFLGAQLLEHSSFSQHKCGDTTEMIRRLCSWDRRRRRTFKNTTVANMNESDQGTCTVRTNRRSAVRRATSHQNPLHMTK